MMHRWPHRSWLRSGISIWLTCRRVTYTVLALLLHGCADDPLRDSLLQLQQRISNMESPSADNLADARALREQVLQRGDPLIDSLYNAIVLKMLPPVPEVGPEYQDNKLLHALFDWSKVPKAFNSRDVSMSTVLFHRFRGKHDAARSCGVPTNLMADPGDAGVPELLANIALEYSRIGLAQHVMVAAGQAEKRYKANGHDRGSLFAQRLLVSAYLSLGDLHRTRYYLRQIRLACDTLDTMQASDDHTVTKLALLQTIKQYPQHYDLATEAFGSGLASIEQTYASYASSTRKPWVVGSLRRWHPQPDLLPKPVIRSFQSAEMQPTWADSFGVGSDGLLTAMTPIGSYVHVGNRWLLHSPTSTAWSTGERMTAWTSDTLARVSQPIRFLFGIGVDSLLLITDDSMHVFSPGVRRAAVLPQRLLRLSVKPTVQRASPHGLTLVTRDLSAQFDMHTLRVLDVTPMSMPVGLLGTSSPDRVSSVDISTGSISALVVDTHPEVLRGLHRHRVDAHAPYQAVRFLDRLDVIDTAADVTYTAAFIPFPMVEPWGPHDTWTVIPSADGYPRCVIPYGNTVRSVRLGNAARRSALRPFVVQTSSYTLDTAAINMEARTIYLQEGRTYTIGIHQPLLASRMPVSLTGMIDGTDRRVQSINHGAAWQVHANTAVDGAMLSLPNKLGSWRIVVIRPWINPTILQTGAYVLSIGSIIGFSIIAYRTRKRRLATMAESIRQEQLTLLREDMHDMIGSRLVRIASLARQGAVKGGEDILDRIHEMTTTTIRSLRNMLSLMSEDGLSDADFFGMIREYVVGACNDVNITCAVRIDITDELTTLTNLGRHELLMIITEMVTNSMRHAECTATRLIVQRHADHLSIHWSDNGKGLDPRQRRGHGLNNIERRSARLRATISIEPAEPTGTSFHISIPIQRA